MENETNVNEQQPNEPTNTEPAGASTGGGDPKPTTPAQNTESNKEPQKPMKKTIRFHLRNLPNSASGRNPRNPMQKNRRRQSAKLKKHDLQRRKEQRRQN